MASDAMDNGRDIMGNTRPAEPKRYIMTGRPLDDLLKGYGMVEAKAGTFEVHFEGQVIGLIQPTFDGTHTVVGNDGHPYQAGGVPYVGNLQGCFAFVIARHRSEPKSR